MNSMEAQQHIEECRRLLEQADSHVPGGDSLSWAIGALITAIGQLAEVVEDLAQREQGRVIA